MARRARGVVQPWSRQELYLLSRLYGACGYTEIAERLGRTPRAVRGQAENLGLHHMSTSELLRRFPAPEGATP